jgi:glutamate--cysteine ligase
MTNLSLLEKIIIGKQTSIEAWFRDQWRKTLIPLYASVDLRNAGFKMAPVDTNLFPGGFNNLNAQAIPLAIQAMGITLEKLIPGCKRLLLIPENHTRNLHYLENVYQLQQILQNAGYEVRIGSLLPDFNLLNLIYPQVNTFC